MKLRVPSRVEDVDIRLFGQVTVGQLARFALFPVFAVLTAYPSITAANLFGIAIGVTTGAVWAAWKPDERFLDEHIRNAISDFTSNPKTEAFLRHKQRGLSEPELEDFDYSKLEEVEVVDDHIENTGEESKTAVIRVEPVNLDMKTGDEKAAAHRTLSNLYRRINYPVQLHSLQEPLSFKDYIQHLENRSFGGDLYGQYLEYCREFDNSRVSTTRHYITVQGDTEEDLRAKCGEVIDTVDTGDLSAYRINNPEKLSGLVNHFKKFSSRRTLAVHELPTQTGLAWTKNLLQVSGQIDITQAIHPEDPSQVTSKLQRLTEKLNAEINSLHLGGHYGTNRLEGLLEDVQWILNKLANREDQPVRYAAYITAQSRFDDTSDDTLERVKNRLDTMQVEYRTDRFLPYTAWTAESPFHTDSWNHSQLMPAESAAAGFPFATRNLENSRGIVYGEDSRTSTPILLNRFSWSSHSMARMGTVGSGKSYATKLEIIRSYVAFDDLHIIIVDPKKEYGHLVKRLNGTVHILDDRYGSSIQVDDEVVSFELDERGEEGNTEQLIDAVRTIRSATSQDQRKTLVVVDEARNLLNDDEGRKVLNNFVLEARDRNTAVTLVTQNASHFTHCREGREILDNMPAKAFMRHERLPDHTVEYFQLSREEKQQILGLKTGDDSRYSEAVLKVSNRIDAKLNIESTGVEDAVISQGENG